MKEGLHSPTEDLSLQGKRGVVSAAQVGEYIGYHINTMTHWNKRYEETMDKKRKIRSDRPSKITHAQDKMLIDAVKAKPITMAQKTQVNQFCLFKIYKIGYRIKSV